MSDRNVATAIRTPSDESQCEWKQRRKRSQCCRIGTDAPPKRPDPAIYSQPRRLALGQPTSWESPDIQTNWWDDWRFMDAIEARIHNQSSESSAVNVLVRMRWAPFGIGTVFESLGDQMISLGLAPDAKLISFPTSAALRELGNDVSIEVSISHPHDKDASNNVGYQAIHGVRTSQVGRSSTMSFAVRNPSASTDIITLAVLANDIGATVSPASRVFAPNEQITATLSVNVPATIVPPAGGFVLKDATVVGYNSGGKLLGGVALLVRIDS